VIIGNPGTGWTRASIWAEPEKLQKVIDGGFSAGHTTIGDAASAK
jgi:hypothetical protein